MVSAAQCRGAQTVCLVSAESGACTAALKTKGLRGRALLSAVLLALLVAGADESYQRRLQHRSGAWGDVAVDALGIAAAGSLLWLRARVRSKHKEVVEENAENECI